MRKIAIFVLFLTYCNSQKGEFYWYPVPYDKLTSLDLALYTPDMYYLGRENLFFGDEDIIYWLYKLPQKSFLKNRLLTVLYDRTGTLHPIEIDFRMAEIESLSGTFLIRQRYLPLRPGKYILKISYENADTPLDEVEFTVLPQEEILQPSGPLLRN